MRWSAGQLLRQFLDIHARLKQARPVPAMVIERSHGDYIASLAHRDCDGAVADWIAQLDGYEHTATAPAEPQSHAPEPSAHAFALIARARVT